MSATEMFKKKPVPKTNKGTEIIISNKNKTDKQKGQSILDRMKSKMSKDTSVDLKSNIDNVEDTRLKITDKTKDKSFNPTDFLDKIRNKREVQNITEDEKMRKVNELKTKKAITKKKEIEIKDPKVKLSTIAEDSTKLETSQKTKRTYTKRKTKGIDISKASQLEIKHVVLGESIKKRLPKKENMVIIQQPSYYMNNREIFVNFMDKIFKPYRNEILRKDNKPSCDDDGEKDFSLFTHQKIVREYLNLYSPYRGLLLYHGLGSGKTCSSIAIAEGFIHLSSIAFAEGITTPKKVIVLTPASLRANYQQQLRQCGNELYRKNQYWEFINIREKPDMVDSLSSALQLPVSFINEKGGAWLVDVEKPSNYEDLNETEQKELNDQIEYMIQYKYTFINYNGLRKSKLATLTQDGHINPFDDKVIIIDEAHNFVSRIVNKIEKEKPGENKFLSTSLYHYLMSAENARIILLTGTPMINYPNEMGILFNILRGYIRVWQIPYENKDHKKNVTTDFMRKIFKSIKSIDYIEANSNILYITKNPFSFVNKYYSESYKGVRLDKDKKINEDNDDEFLEKIIKTLDDNKIKVISEKIKLELTKALPDKLEEFQELFIDSDEGKIKSEDIFKRRILGLTSYFRSADEQLMPQLIKYEDKDYYEIRIDMSDYQFEKYQEVRLSERDLEKKNKRKARKKKKNDLYEDTTSTYRIFSRAFCNFVFPTPPGRPMPGDDGLKEFEDEDIVDGLTIDQRRDNIDGRVLLDDEDESSVVENNEYKTYVQRIQEALNTLDENKGKYLRSSSYVELIEESEKKDEEDEEEKEEEKEEEEEEEKEEEKEEENDKDEGEDEGENDEGEKVESKQLLNSEEKEGDSPIVDFELNKSKEPYDYTKKIPSDMIGKYPELETKGYNKKEKETYLSLTSKEKRALNRNYDLETRKKSLIARIEGDDHDVDKPNTPEGVPPGYLSEDDKEEGEIDWGSTDESKNKQTGGEPDGLEKYSPKFLHILENMLDKKMKGCHLLYSQFRTLEGIGIFSLVLEANGFTMFKLKKNSSQEWELNMQLDKIEKGKVFGLYTGTETVEEKELMRSIYNGDVKNIPMSILEELKKIAPNNNYGEWIKVFMITSSGAEGINLKNTRFVHIMEPYWHPVRKEQVIGRARRICSHQELPEEDRNVKVFLYLMQFTKHQIDDLMSTEIRNNDISKYDIKNKTPQTSDETLHEISNRKENISKQLLRSVKEAAMDCAIHYTKDSDETLECYSFGNQVDPNIYSYRPNIKQEDRDMKIAAQNKQTVNWEAVEWVGDGKTYALRIDSKGNPTNQLYDYDTYLQAKENPNVTARLTAKIVEKNGKKFLDTNV
jgi:hypothetical protein